MIENTWRWAAENNKIIKHPISGGEFVEIDLESMSRKVHSKGSELSQTSGGVYQVLMHAARCVLLISWQSYIYRFCEKFDAGFHCLYVWASSRCFGSSLGEWWTRSGCTAAYFDTGHWCACMYIYLLCEKKLHACMSVCLLLSACMWNLSRTKGPAEKVTFPTCSQTMNPFQILPSFLMILGRKLDGGSQVQDPSACMFFFMHACFFFQSCKTPSSGKDKLEPFKDSNSRAKELEP